jgi:transposase
MTTMSQKAYQRYTPVFRANALALLALGKPVSEVAQELGVGSGLLYKWRAEAQREQGASAGQHQHPASSVPPVAPAADTLHGLQRENTRLRAENDILKKAAIILGSITPLSCAR